MHVGNPCLPLPLWNQECVLGSNYDGIKQASSSKQISGYTASNSRFLGLVAACTAWFPQQLNYFDDKFNPS